MFRGLQRIFVFVVASLIFASSLSLPAYANGHGLDWHEGGVIGKVTEWIGGTTLYDKMWGTDHSWQYAASKPQKYYTTPTSSVQDKKGNVTNYYRGGDTTDISIIDSYNKTFNTIHNTTNNTNNYKANVRLEDFLNNYTTNNITSTTNNKYTYSADFKSWYYDNTTNNYNYTTFEKNDYTQNNLYYNQDNSRYYISIDNSTDEYYLVDVQYSPTFVTVNYTYNTTNNKYDSEVGDVTNVYYYELKDGRNSADLTAAEIAGLDVGYDVANYELVTDDPNTLSLQHFDGDYTDSSSFNRTFYSENRSTNYVDSGAFGKAVALPNGSAAGVTIPGLSGYNDLSFDFRVHYSDIASLGVYFGNTNIFQRIPGTRKWTGQDIYSDHGQAITSTTAYGNKSLISLTKTFSAEKYYDYSEISPYLSPDCVPTPFSSSHKSQMDVPARYDSPNYVDESSARYGWVNTSGVPSLYSSTAFRGYYITRWISEGFGRNTYSHYGTIRHYTEKEYRWTPSQYVHANFSYDSYRSQWVSMRITLSGNNIYYFVNGDLVGSGSFTRPAADKFYIKSSGTVYLDELRVTTGSLSSTGVYTPSSAPYDTNKVLALPDKLTTGTIYVQSNVNVTDSRIGGVRPSNPSAGFFYIPLHSDHTGGQPQIYDGNNWVDVTAMVYDGSKTVTALGFQFAPVGSLPDVDTDAKPERPSKPGDDVDPDTCKHNWEETKRTDATCTLPGTVTSTCTKCEKTKTETLPKVGHTWEVKQTTQTSYDENGNVLTQGFTIYRCSVCGEEYKDTDGTGPPASPSTPSDPDDPGEEDGWLAKLLQKLGDFLGSTVGALLKLLGSILDGILDGLISLVTGVLDRLSQLVDLFGSFGEALGVLWTWLPTEVMTVLVAGVTIFVLLALLRLFLK